jgi:predicted metal-dependent enzyme (double-stranded beta helix superfamily)
MDVLAPPAAPSTLVMAELCTVVRSVAGQPEAWRAPLVFDPAERWSRLLYADDRYDVWILTWLPGQGTDLHDHDASAAAFTVVRGSLVEARPNRRGRMQPELLPMGFTRWVAPGAVHQVSNQEKAPAVSVHAYSPPLRVMTSYDNRRGRLIPQRREPLAAAASVDVA